MAKRQRGYEVSTTLLKERLLPFGGMSNLESPVFEVLAIMRREWGNREKTDSGRSFPAPIEPLAGDGYPLSVGQLLQGRGRPRRLHRAGGETARGRVGDASDHRGGGSRPPGLARGSLPYPLTRELYLTS